ncbi:MAG: hypothetical protein JW741_15625 [Sedimentisphaerales bacterium]|nr:hypothetical protein [Sedimentisphaerales bacterium]
MKTFWQHNNGRVYAVESDTFGKITGAAGPLDPDDLHDLDAYHYGPASVQWIEDAIAQRTLRKVERFSHL